MVIGTALGLHDVATVALDALTMRGVLRAGLDVRAALKVARR